MSYRPEDIFDALPTDDVVQAIRRTFAARMQSAMRLPLLSRISVADVTEIRALQEWRPFIDEQRAILSAPLSCLDRLGEFQSLFSDFQGALSSWYHNRYGAAEVRSRYANYVTVAVSLAGRVIVAGADLPPIMKVPVGQIAGSLAQRLPSRIKGLTVKLMMCVYDVEAQQLARDHSYSIELMQTAAEMTRDEVADLIDQVTAVGEDALPHAGRLADQGVD